MDEVYDIQAEMDWNDDTLLNLVLSFAEKHGHIPALVQYLSQIANEEKSWDDEDSHLPGDEN